MARGIVKIDQKELKRQEIIQHYEMLMEHLSFNENKRIEEMREAYARSRETLDWMLARELQELEARKRPTIR